MVSPEEAGTGSLGNRGLGLAKKWGGGEGDTEREGGTERERVREEFLGAELILFISFSLAVSVSLWASRGFGFQDSVGFGIPGTNVSLPLSLI